MDINSPVEVNDENLWTPGYLGDMLTLVSTIAVWTEPLDSLLSVVALQQFLVRPTGVNLEECESNLQGFCVSRNYRTTT